MSYLPFGGGGHSIFLPRFSPVPFHLHAAPFTFMLRAYNLRAPPFTFMLPPFTSGNIKIEPGKKIESPPAQKSRHPESYIHSYTMPFTNVVYAPQCCSYNAYVNQRNAYKDLNLKWVFGSCAYNGFWEYGGPDYDDYDDYKRGDFHVWLEDKEGRVYDFVTAQHDFCARVNTGKPLKVRGIIEGKTKEELAALGVTYRPASDAIRLKAFLKQLPVMKMAEQAVLEGRTYAASDAAVADAIYDYIPTDLGQAFKNNDYLNSPKKGKDKARA